jgi:hypothetical protein
MAELIAPITGAFDSAPFTILAGDSVTLLLKDAVGPYCPPNCVVFVQQQSSGGEWFTVGQLDTQTPAKVLLAAGTFRVSKPVSADAYGADSN